MSKRVFKYQCQHCGAMGDVETACRNPTCGRTIHYPLLEGFARVFLPKSSPGRKGGEGRASQSRLPWGKVFALGVCFLIVLWVLDGLKRWLLADFRAVTATTLRQAPDPSSTEATALEAGTWLLCVRTVSGTCETADTPSGRWVHIDASFGGGGGWAPYATLAFDLPFYKDLTGLLVHHETTQQVDARVREDRVAALERDLEAAPSGTSKSEELLDLASRHNVPLKGMARCLVPARAMRRSDEVAFETFDAARAFVAREPACEPVLLPELRKKLASLEQKILARSSAEKLASPEVLTALCALLARPGDHDNKALQGAVQTQLQAGAAACRKKEEAGANLAKLYRGGSCEAARSMPSAPGLLAAVKTLDVACR